MVFLVLGKGKTGSLVAQVARDRGHSVRVFDVAENPHASALTAPNAWPASMWSSTSPPPSRARKHARHSLPRLPHRCRHHRLVQAPRRHARAGPATGRLASLRHQLLHRRADLLPPHRRVSPVSMATPSPSKKRTTSPSSTRLRAPPSPCSRSLRPNRKKPASDAEVEVRSHRVGDAKGRAHRHRHWPRRRDPDPPRCAQPPRLRARRGSRRRVARP